MSALRTSNNTAIPRSLHSFAATRAVAAHAACIAFAMGSVHRTLVLHDGRPCRSVKGGAPAEPRTSCDLVRVKLDAFAFLFYFFKPNRKHWLLPACIFMKEERPCLWFVMSAFLCSPALIPSQQQPHTLRGSFAAVPYN